MLSGCMPPEPSIEASIAGSGKTLAFLLPAFCEMRLACKFNSIAQASDSCQAYVLYSEYQRKEKKRQECLSFFALTIAECTLKQVTTQIDMDLVFLLCRSLRRARAFGCPLASLPRSPTRELAQQTEAEVRTVRTVRTVRVGKQQSQPLQRFVYRPNDLEHP